MAFIKYSLINIKICKNKTHKLIKNMQSFELPLTDNIKTCLLLLKHLFRLFSNYVIKFYAFFTLGNYI